MIKGSLNRTIILLFMALFPASPVFSALSLTQQASAFVAQQMQTKLQPADQLEVHINTTDTRLQLPACRETVTFRPNRALEPGRFSLKASCSTPKRWSIHINGSIKVFRPILVSSRALAKSSVINASNTQLLRKEISALRSGYFTTIQQVDGYRLRRSVQQQQVLKPQLLDPPLLIQKDDEIVINAGAGSKLNVRVLGVALQDGRMNQQINVKNKTSGKIIRARVTAIGEVHVGQQ